MLQKKLHIFFPPIAVSILLFLLTYYFFGFYAETNDDLAFIWGLKGYFSLQPITDFLYYHHGLSSFYAALYTCTNQIAWYGWAMYAYLFIAALFAYFVLKNEKRALWENLLIFAAFFTAIFYQHLVHFNFTRSAFLLIIGSFLWALKEYCSKQEEEEKKYSTSNKWFAFGWLFFFTIGFLTRPTTAYLSLVLLFPLGIYLALKNNRLKQVRRAVYFPIFALILGFHILQWLTISPEKQVIIDKQASIAHLVNAKIVKDDKGKTWTARDSIIYETTLHWLVGDKETLTKSTLAKYTFEEDLVVNADTLQRIPNVLEELLKRIWKEYKAVLFWIAFIVMLSFWRAVSSPTSKREAFSIPVILILFQLFFVLVLVGVNITMKMPNRVLEPLLLLNMLVVWMLLPSAYWSKKMSLSVALGVFLLSGFSAKNTFESTRPFLKAQIERQEMVAELNKQLQRKIVLFTLPSAILMEDVHPLKPLNLSANNQYLFLQGWLTALPNFYESLAELTRISETTFRDAFVELAKQEELRLIGNKQTVELLSNYFEVVYEEELIFYESEKQLKGFEEQGLMVYQLSIPNPSSVN